jgi:hypothetical protein
MSTVHTRGRLRGEKVRYKDGIGLCIWYPMPGADGEEESGICFDISGDDLADAINLLLDLREAEPDVFEEEKP